LQKIAAKNKKCGNFARETEAKCGNIAQNCEKIAQYMRENGAYVVTITKKRI